MFGDKTAFDQAKRTKIILQRIEMLIPWLLMEEGVL